MPLWGKSDANTSSPKFAASCARLHPNSVTQNTLYNNTTVNAITNNQCVGSFAIGAANNASFPDSTHSGWVLRRVGTGGRAGRVQTETLVCISAWSTTTTNSFFIYLLVPPVATQNVANGSATTIPLQASVAPNSAAEAATVTYTWQIANSTNGFNSLAANANYTGVSTNTLSIANTAAMANTGANMLTIFRCLIQATGCANVITANSSITTH